MTLVSAFLHEGTPILIGDSLITSQLQVNPGKTTPLLEDLLDKFPHAGETNIVELLQKIHIVSDSFCVGYCGDTWGAQDAIKSLCYKFAQSEPTKESLAEHLATLHHSHPHDFQLTGWLYNDDIFSNFIWASNQPTKISYQSQGPVCIGSGASYLERLLGSADIPFSNSPASYAISIVSRLLASEQIYGEAVGDSFGGIYQIVIFGEDHFSYVPSVTYIFLKLDEVVKNKQLALLGPIKWLITNQRTDCMEAQTLTLDENSLGLNSAPAGPPKSQMYYVPSVLTETGDSFIVRDNLSLNTAYYAIGVDLRLVDHTLPIMTFSLTLPHEKAMKYLTLREESGVETLGIRDEFSKKLFHSLQNLDR